jgi:hypothetical protein
MSKLWDSGDPAVWEEALQSYEAVLEATGKDKLQRLER